MKLFHSPGSCSLGIRILLELAEVRFETVTVSIAQGAHRAPEYLALNPKGKVPALLRPDGTLLTEFPVIALWIARTFPEAGLLPGGDDEYRTLEIVEYVVSTLHMRGATLAMRPEKFAADPAAQKEVRAHGHAMVAEGLEALSARLDGRDWFFDRPGLADAAVFYLLNWKDRMGVTLPANLAGFHQRMAALPGVARALA